MLTFFRRIRKGLLDGNRTSKYLLYAIGEIALVVIGILIALQINNWNEWRKDRISEDKILMEIKESLVVNIDRLEDAVLALENYNKSSKKSENCSSTRLSPSSTVLNDQPISKCDMN